MSVTVARSLPEVYEALAAQPEAQLLAGGTDFMVEVNFGHRRPLDVVALRSVPELMGWEREGDEIVIAAGCTYRELEEPEVALVLPALAQAARTVGSPQIRNAGTIAGNLCQRPFCWYFRSANFSCLRKGGQVCYTVTGDSRFHAILGAGPSYIVHPSDTAPALVALGATIKIAGSAGEKTIPLEKFFVLPSVDYKRENVLGPGEIVTEIIVPTPKPGSKGFYYKVRERLAWDHAIVAVATIIESNGTAEEFLRGKAINEANAKRAGEIALEGAKPLKDNNYKITIARDLIQRAVLASV